ncbi:Ig-like domain-containing protein [Bradyrhizobium sp.]|uniref:Ig-like domain-containing protein n=1 Tax=Bradyrhizobium sp. TaxID=376 RepID=UPI002C5A70E6|nr:Ig-like domain-containing protein [Bradyrhizobium sp.]HMM88329.1 Ig-like domain-containing protein [Bradyrhizobium sp.]
MPSVTDFRPASDNWSNPIKVDGQGWYVENGNKAWSLTNPDSHTIRMEVRPGDVWGEDGTARSEILTATNALDQQVFNASFTMTVEPGQINNVAWLSLAQMHEDAGIPFSIQLLGDKMTILANQNSGGGLVYSDPNQIVRGHAYDIQIKANFSTDSTGFLQIWRDGIQIVDYHGKLGSETGGQYLKLGVYEGYPEQVKYSTAVDYSNIVVTYNDPNVPTPSSAGNGNTGGSTPTPPTAPTIATFSTDSGVAGDRITNDSTLTLTGAAAANSTVKVFDGSTQVGTATANASGAWSLTTTALTEGNHSLTAKATNSGGTSSASTALSVTVDTVAPTAPTISASTPTSSRIEVLTGTAEANSTVKILDGSTEIGTATANGNGAWTYSTSALSTGSHSFTAKAMDAAGNTGSASAAAVVNLAATTPAPSAPTIGTFSTDSGVAGDRITNDNTLTLTGTAAANSTVKVFDGGKQIGTATADANGSWGYTTTALADAAHVLTATATNAGGQTSAASAALSVTVDTLAPVAPTMAASTSAASLGSANTTAVLSGAAEANSTVKLFDGTTQIGTATVNGSGAWSYTTAALSTGSHSFTAKAMDAAGNTGSASAASVVNITGSATPAPSAPKIASFSTDSGVAGDKITNDSTLALTGTAAASSIVKVFDGSTQVGTANANSNGQWTYTTQALSDGGHSLTATATDAQGHTSAASAALAVTIDTHAPGAPTMGVFSQAGSAVGSTTTLDDLILKGTAEANSTVKVFDGSTQIGTATASGSGTWSFDTGHLDSGSHSFTSKAVDIAGNIGAASASANVGITAPPASAPTDGVDITSLSKGWWNSVTIKGTADPNSTVKLFDGEKAMGSVTASADGNWAYTTKLGYSNAVHTYSAQEVDSTGNVVAKSSGQAILGSSFSNKLASTAGDDLFVGNGGTDTFAFAANFGNDVIRDFDAVGRRHDVVEFSKSEFDSFASVLSHASQVGQDVVISAGSDSLTLKNTKLSTLDSHDFHFA